MIIISFPLAVLSIMSWTKIFIFLHLSYFRRSSSFLSPPAGPCAAHLMLSTAHSDAHSALCDGSIWWVCVMAPCLMGPECTRATTGGIWMRRMTDSETWMWMAKRALDVLEGEGEGEGRCESVGSISSWPWQVSERSVMLFLIQVGSILRALGDIMLCSSTNSLLFSVL